MFDFGLIYYRTNLYILLYITSPLLLKCNSSYFKNSKNNVAFGLFD